MTSSYSEHEVSAALSLGEKRVFAPDDVVACAQVRKKRLLERSIEGPFAHLPRAIDPQ